MTYLYGIVIACLGFSVWELFFNEDDTEYLEDYSFLK